MRKLSARSTVLLVCDIQERFATIIHGFQSVVKTTEFLVKSAKELEMPIVVTEQYPKAFKRTVGSIDEILVLPEGDGTANLYKKCEKRTKTLFSMLTPEVKEHLRSLNCTSAIVCGIEAHVCVLQTTLDLLDMGIDVHICADAVSSQRPFDRSIALNRLSNAGAVLATSESLLFQIIGDSAHPKFKALQPLIKDNATNSATSELLHL